MIAASEMVLDPLLAEVFESVQSIEIEIGCGKGKFLVERSGQHSGIFFIGIDRLAKWMKIGQKRGEKRNLLNLHFLRADIREFLKHVPPGRVSRFHIYFPDPWPKRRHRRRRLVTPVLLGDLHLRLETGSFVDLATDDEDYFRQMQSSVSSLLWESSERLNQRFEDEMMKTNYELKYEAAGRPLYYLRLKKKRCL